MARGQQPQLVFDSDQEAVDKILGVLKNPHEQQRLQETLRHRSEELSETRFVREVRELVAAFRE